MARYYNNKAIPSLSFSGAGFVASYHFGVAKCLIEYGYLPSTTTTATRNSEQQNSSHPLPILCGTSSGALVAAAIAVGVGPYGGLKAIETTAAKSKAAGSRFKPGHSLVDIIEEVVGDLILDSVSKDSNKSNNKYSYLHHILGNEPNQNTSTDNDSNCNRNNEIPVGLLRIGLTDRRVFPPVGNYKASVYIDQYRDIYDIIAACLISCYMPGFTGPIFGSLDTKNDVINRSSIKINELLQLGYIKDAVTNQPLIELNRGHTGNSTTNDDNASKKKEREIFWDGAFNNISPIVDEETIMVTPIVSSMASANPLICPLISNSTSSNISKYLPKVPAGSNLKVDLTTDNSWLVFGANLQEENLLEKWFDQGYDDTQRFFEQQQK